MDSKVKKYNFNFPTELIERVDQFGERLNINRTSAMCVLLNTALQNDKMIESVPTVIEMYQSIQEAQKVTQ